MTDSDLEGLAMQASLERKLFGVELPQLKIGRFVVLQRLGQGGMGLVFAVYDDRLDRRVALKLLKGDASSALRERLAREAKAMARLSHPNVVPVFEVDEHEGQLFIVMEYVRGKTLRAWVAAEPLSVDAILDKYIQAGRGLVEKKDSGVVHQDASKPEPLLHAARERARELGALAGQVREGEYVVDGLPPFLAPHAVCRGEEL